MLERETTIMILLNGGRIGFLSGDIQNLQSDAQALRPTEFPLVPRILNKLYEKVQNQTNASKWKKILFELAFSAKLKQVKQGIYTKNTIFDRLVFEKIRQKFGGRLERLATGSAPISNDVMLFSRVIFGCPIMECYGQTEATCCVTSTHPFDPNIGHVGSPLVCYMVKLIDVPEMDYYAKNRQGEICVKGPSRFKGYLKDEEKTAEAIDKDGWLHTGDIGTWLPNGALKIIDRKKNLFKLSQGEYISPEKIENVYLRSRFVAQVFVDGNSLKNHLVAIIVPEAEFLLDYAAKNQINGDFQQLCKNNVIKETLLKDITKFGKEAGLMSYEQVKNIHLHAELMSLQNGLCTPTLKIKRHEARKYFQDVINKMYDD